MNHHYPSGRLRFFTTALFSACLVGCGAVSSPEGSKAGSGSPVAATVQHIGAATTLLSYAGRTVLTDPSFDPKGGDYDIGIDVLHKTEDAAVMVEQLPPIDIVLLSHDQHADNFDHSGRRVAASAGVIITTTAGAARLGGGAVGLDPWASHTIGELTITAVPAQHGPAPAVPVLGDVIGFILHSPGAPTIYISGDTVPFPGLDEIVKAYEGKIDYALLHAGHVGKTPGVAPFFSMSGAEAVKLASRLDAKRFSIIHADSWRHFREPLADALGAVRSSSIADRLLELPRGQTLTIPGHPFDR